MEPKPIYEADTSPTLAEAQAQLLDLLGERRLIILSKFLHEICANGFGAVEIVIAECDVQLLKIKSVK